MPTIRQKIAELGWCSHARPSALVLELLARFSASSDRTFRESSSPKKSCGNPRNLAEKISEGMSLLPLLKVPKGIYQHALLNF